MNLLELKPITTQMLKAVVELDQLCFGGLWTMEGYEREIDSPNADLLGLSLSGYPAFLVGMGCLWAIVDEAHITILAIHPRYQSQGFGQFILLTMLRLAQKRGLERASLEVRTSNKGAIALYQKFGFKTAGIRKRYYSDTGEDALILWKGGLQEIEFVQNVKTWQQELRSRIVKDTGYQLRVH